MSHRRSDVGGVKRLNIQCYSVMRGMDCPNRGVMRVEKFEETILDRILPLALDDQFFARSDETYALANDVAAIQKLIADKRAQKGRAVKLLMTPDFAEDTDIMAQAATAQRIITQSEDRLRVAQQALNTARGSVEPAEHLKRVTAVRGAINDPDPAVRVPARAKVHAALKAIVEVVLCDNIDNGEKTFRVSVIGGLIGFKVAAATGEIVRQWNITGRLDSNPTWARAVNHRDNGPAVLADVMRRQG